MFRNYFKTSIRNLWNNRVFSLLNIAGLAIGIACAALIFLWVEDELNYNDYFTNKENIYKVKNFQTYDGATYVFDATPGPLASGLQSEIPGIKVSARSTWSMEMPFNVGEKSLSEKGLYVDSSFFNLFSLQFIEGNAATAFSDLKAIVITQKMAKKFFGEAKAIGRQIKMGNNEPFIVSGVINDLPENVSIDFEWLAPFQNFEKINDWLQYWGANGIITYVQTNTNANVSAINKLLQNYLGKKQEGLNYKLAIYPMNRWRLYDSFDNGKEVEGRIKFVHLFSLIAWIIILIACINFMNLSTARSEGRAREVGVRKVLGAHKKSLVTQFMVESLIMAFISAFLAVIIVLLALPFFNILVEKQLTPGLNVPLHWVALIAIAVIGGLIAGSYPAFYLSSFNPVKVLKGLKTHGGGGAGFIRKGLVVIQFTVSIVLIVSTIIIYQQINHIKTRNLGYDKENLITIPLHGDMLKNYSVLKNELIATGMVQNTGLCNSDILNYGTNTGEFQWKGKDPNKRILITTEGVTPDFIPTVGYHLKAGRNFYNDMLADSTNIIINDALAKMLNTSEIIGSVIAREGGTPYTVVGVIDDFVYGDMYSTGAPMIFFSDTSNNSYLMARLRSGIDTKVALTKIEKVIKSFNPALPFDYQFVDTQFGKLFKTETLIGKLASVFADLAIFISCLGLFGLAAYTAERRTREIGIRKVLGANMRKLVLLLSQDFIMLVAISCLIAFPIAWWIMHNWLQDYAYRINIDWTVFAIAGMLALAIAIITVSFQAIKTARMNPVTSIKSE